MKKAMKFLGIIALALIIGFSMAACGGGDDDDDTTTPTPTPKPPKTYPSVAIDGFEVTETVKLAAYADYAIEGGNPPVNEGLAAKFITGAELTKVTDAAPGSRLQIIFESTKESVSSGGWGFGRIGNNKGQVSDYPGINTTAIELNASQGTPATGSAGYTFSIDFDIDDQIAPTMIKEGGLPGNKAIYVNTWSDFIVGAIYVFEYAGPENASVTGVANMPTTSPVSAATITLPTEASPGYATNRDITWSLTSAGTTGASLSANVLSGINAIGTIKVKATITDGLYDDDTELFENAVFDYEIKVVATEFNITVDSATVKVQVSDLVVDGQNAVVGLPNGYEVSNCNYDWASVQIPITLTGKTFGDITNISAKVTGIAGDPVSYKDYKLYASGAKIAGQLKLTAVADAVAVNGVNDSPEALSFDIDADEVDEQALGTLTKFYIIFWAGLDGTCTYQITDIVITF